MTDSTGFVAVCSTLFRPHDVGQRLQNIPYRYVSAYFRVAGIVELIPAWLLAFTHLESFAVMLQLQYAQRHCLLSLYMLLLR